MASHGNVHVIASKQDWEAKLAEAQANGKIVVVDFTATWCGPCKMIAPIYEELSMKHPQLVFLKVDVDDMHEICNEWDVHAMPTFIFIKDGKAVDKVVGMNPELLESRIMNSVSMTQAA